MDGKKQLGEMDYLKIKVAVESIAEGYFSKTEGKGWKAYRVGNIIRIDIKDE